MIWRSFCEDSVYDGFYVIYFSLYAPPMAYLVSKNGNLMQDNEPQKTSKLELTCNAVFTKCFSSSLKTNHSDAFYTELHLINPVQMPSVDGNLPLAGKKVQSKASVIRRSGCLQTAAYCR